MATSANLPSGAIAANGGDPFTGSPTVPPPGPARFAPFDNDQFSAYSTSSPSQARRALEAHLKDTDRRIQDASKLGTTLLQQRKNLASRLQEVEELSKDHDVPAELQQRLTALEKEYNDIGRESARAFLPKSRPLPGDSTPSVYSSTSGRESPTKVSAPSRRQRNQPSNRVHDIEFATEISTQLLAQVRQLQTALAEKDEELKDAATSRTQLENDHLNIVQRAKLLDENLQRHRDENWNLETKIQDLETSMRESADREQRLQQTLKTTHTEKTTAERDLDELKALHEKATDEHATVQRHHEADLHTLRRDAANHESEKQTLHKKIEELTSQNTELAKAVSYRWNQGAQPTQAGAKASDESEGADEPELDHTDLISPVKGTPARGGLESETLKSSLNHAHRMIQNLKNNIHREKTEKVELKRMLADARDELEKRRDSNAGIGAANLNKKRADAAKARKPIRADRLGANRTSTTEIINDEGDWEESDDPTTPSKTSFGRPATGAAAMPGAFQETDTSDAFETADERRGDTATETEAFQTGAESFGDDSDLTETESISKRPSTSTSRKSATPSIPTRPGMPGDRHSYLSTASASGEEYEDEDVVRTPVQSQGPKYRLRVNRGLRTSSGPSLNDRLTQSPASSMGTPQPAGQSLGDELDALDDDDDSIEGTPNTRFSASPYTSPEMHRTRSVEPEIQASEDEPVASIESGDGADDTQRSIGSPFTSPVKSRKSPAQKEFLKPKPAMVDSGMMTEPWQPEKEIIVQRIPAEEATEDDNKAASAVAGAAGGALAGIGLGRLSKHDGNNDEQKAVEGDESSGDETPAGLLTPSRKKAHKDQATSPEPAVPQVDPIVFQHSAVLTQETEPIAAPVEEKAPAIPFQQSSIFAQETEPVSPPRPVVKAPVPFELAGAGNATRQSMVYSQETEPVSPPKPAVKSPPMLGLAGAGDPSGQSAIYSQETEPVTPPRPAAKAPPALALAGAGNASRQSLVYSQETEPVSPPRAAPVDAAVGTQSQPQEFGFSAVSQQDFEPQDVSRPLVPRRSSRRMDMLYTSESEKGADAVRASAPPGLYGEDDPALAQRRELTSRDAGADATPRAIPGHLTEHERALSSDSMIPITKPLSVKRPMAESGSQTEVSGDEIDRMMRDKTNVLAGAGAGALAGAGVVGAAAAAAGNARRSVDSAMSSTFQPRPSTPNDNSTLHVPRQSSSTSNMRGSANMDAPPLPADHNKKIAAAAHKGPVMGPPAMPASAFKQPRPRTPVGAQGGTQIYRPMSKDSNTVRPAGRAGSGVSRQASVSSFASELDERFNIHNGRFPYPDDMPPTTDPRMIQAITQTMIGEFLWKYTRKAGRNEMSSTRHRRFFWVHPYTRTLYWSESDPTTAGKNMMKAKSMSIEAVRVITDDNTNPPGLHRKSIVVVTPGREIVFTAPTGQRHETWFNALSYLLLRTESERHEADDTINEEDLEDFNPEHDAHHPGGAFSFRRSVSRMTGRSQSRRSLSSYHSRSRPSSPTKTPLSQQHQPTTPRPPLNGTPTLTPTTHDNYASTRSRLSSFTGRLRNPSAQRGSFTSSSRPGAQSAMSARTDDPASTVEGSAIYNASVVSDSAEDLRAVIERQERDADRLENVRACCDGKHDVGSLSRRGGRHASFTSRAAVRGHSHGPPPAPTTGASGLGIAGQGGQSLRGR